VNVPPESASGYLLVVESSPAPAGSPDSTQRPIFIVGSNGSGSTLLRLMLDSHERIAIPGETGFLRLVLAHQWIPYWELGDRWYGHLGLSEDELMARLSTFYGGLFEEYADRLGKPRWGEKTPFHTWLLPQALRLFPDAVVVGIVRHPGAVAVSLHDRFGRDLTASARHWRRSNLTMALALMRLGNQATLLRYEDLVTNPEGVMRAVLKRVGEPWSPAVLAHHRVQADRGATEAEGFTRVDRPLDPSRIDGWEASIGPADRKEVLGRTSALARFYGYSLDSTTLLPGWGAASPVLTGTELRARRRTDGKSVRWKNPPNPGPPNRLLLPRHDGVEPSSFDVTVPALVRHRSKQWARRVLPDALLEQVSAVRRRQRSGR
jgi:hypothetical protein